MTPPSDTIRNLFIGSACGKHGKVHLKGNAMFTPLRALRIIPKQWAFADAQTVVCEARMSTELPANLKAELDAWQAARDEALESIDVQLTE